jgi:DUF1680 family protein
MWEWNSVIVSSSTRLLKANPAVTEDRGRVAFQRGPIVFCIEHLDQPGHEHDMNMAGYMVHADASTTSHFDPNLLNGVMVLDHPGSISRMPADLGLYYPETEKEAVQEEPTTLKLIPYYAWANRGPASMQVWIPSSRA